MGSLPDVIEQQHDMLPTKRKAEKPKVDSCLSKNINCYPLKNVKWIEFSTCTFAIKCKGTFNKHLNNKRGFTTGETNLFVLTEADMVKFLSGICPFKK